MVGEVALTGPRAAAGRARIAATLAVAVACVSFAAVFIRLAAAPPLTVAFYRLAIAAALFGALSGRGTLAAARALDRGRRRALLSAGVALGAHFALWVASLSYTSLVNAVVLVATQPLWAALLSWWWLSERPGPRTWAGMALALCGSALLSGVHAPAAGDLLAVAAAVAAAAYLTLGRGVRDALPLGRHMFAVHAVAALSVAPLCAATGGLGAPTPRALVWIALLALVPSLAGHTLLNRAVRLAPSYVVSLAILAEPVLAALIAWPALGEIPSPRAAAGGAVILAGVAMAAYPRGPRPR